MCKISVNGPILLPFTPFLFLSSFTSLSPTINSPHHLWPAQWSGQGFFFPPFLFCFFMALFLQGYENGLYILHLAFILGKKMQPRFQGARSSLILGGFPMNDIVWNVSRIQIEFSLGKKWMQKKFGSIQTISALFRHLEGEYKPHIIFISFSYHITPTTTTGGFGFGNKVANPLPTETTNWWDTTILTITEGNNPVLLHLKVRFHFFSPESILDGGVLIDNLRNWVKFDIKAPDTQI